MRLPNQTLNRMTRGAVSRMCQVGLHSRAPRHQSALRSATLAFTRNLRGTPGGRLIASTPLAAFLTTGCVSLHDANLLADDLKEGAHESLLHGYGGFVAIRGEMPESLQDLWVQAERPLDFVGKTVSSSAGPTSESFPTSFLRQGLFSYLVAALLVVSPAFTALAGDAARAGETSPVSTKETAAREKETPLPYVPQPVEVNSLLSAVRESAVQVPSLFLSRQQKLETIEEFLRLIRIKSPSREEGAVRQELKRRMILLGAEEIASSLSDSNAPLNLVMKLPATEGFQNRPALILNAHIDTIPHLPEHGLFYTPEEMDFDVSRREFFHRQKHSFGADDKAGVTVIFSALKTAKAGCWEKGIGHRKIIVILTAQEERGARGAKYLAQKYPEVFADAEISLTTDGPLDYGGEYPEHLFVVVVKGELSRVPPFSRIVRFVEEISAFKEVSFALTTAGLGAGDFAFFPAEAKADLHIRAPYQGQHTHEKVRLEDLYNHIDLFTYIILSLDGVSFEMDKEEGRLQPVLKQGERPSPKKASR